MNLKAPEILAPVGGKDAFFAALNSGADAVFLGLKQFNARARAENFSISDLQELVPLAHRFDMKVLITLNILIKDIELADLIDVLVEVEALEVDAVIVQDLGVAKIVKQYFPTLRMHASTQMAVHNLAGVKQAIQLGFRRVVLARELTALEIKKIKTDVGDSAELEAFCHGSLCYSYSGLCFFSGAADARSGNRGECAYTCRKPYKVLNEPGHGFLFSMKDLNTAETLHLLVDAGVDTLKIEGRKKDAQYVSTAVRLYRKRLNEIFGCDTLRGGAPQEAKDFSSNNTVEDDLNWSFHRGMTSLFLKGRYLENVIDLDNPTHKGMRVGEIIKVSENTIRIMLEYPIERFDGLRIDPPKHLYHALPQHGQTNLANKQKLSERYQNEVMQFSLREMNLRGKNVSSAVPGNLIDIVVPTDFKPSVGDVVTKIRSADLKRRIDALLHVPNGTRATNLRSIDIKVIAKACSEAYVIEVRLLKCGELLFTHQRNFEKQKAKSPTDNHGDLLNLFSLFGDIGFFAQSCEIDAEEGWFLPRSSLKEFKRDTAEKIDLLYTRRMEQKSKDLKSSILNIMPVQEPAKKAALSIKIDRLEYLETLNKISHALDEVVFEPKRAFLSTLNPEDIAQQLTKFSKSSHVRLRLAFPTVIRAWDEPLLKRWFVAANAAGIRAFEVGNLGAIELLKTWNIAFEDLSSDFTLYALNRKASETLADLGIQKIALSIEDDHVNMKHHLENWTFSSVSPQVILYKDTPLFIAESCSLTALHDGCPTSAVCGYRTLEIENDEGEKFYVAHENCKSIVYGKKAFSLSRHRNDFSQWGIKDFRVDFLTRHYEPSDILKIIDVCLNGSQISETHEAHFENTLL